MYENNCTIVVSSCDLYEDTWLPFFKILKTMWPERPYPIVLNTESKSFHYEDMDIRTFQFYKPGKKIPWGARLIKTLENIDTDYIIFLLDDFFLLKRVDQKRIENCIGWMESDKNISVFSFWRTRKPNIKDNIYPHFEKRPQNGEYRLNCQAAVWRRKKLIEYVRPHENPWQWETIGSERSKRYKEKFYSAIEGEPYIFEYDWFSGGGIHRGKWTHHVQELFVEYNINIDLSIRGLEEVSEKNTEKSNIVRLLLRKSWSKIKNGLIGYKSLK